MDYVLDSGRDVALFILICAGLGGLGGIAYDLTEPLRRRRGTDQTATADSFGDNRLSLPRKLGAEPALWEAGFFGPIFVGAVAAVAATLLLGINRPDPTSATDRAAVVDALEERAAPRPAVRAVEAILREPRDPFAEWEKAIPIALLAGFSGVAVLRAARGRVLDAIRGVAHDARIEGVGDAKNKILDAQRKQREKATGRPRARHVRLAGGPTVLTALAGKADPEEMREALERLAAASHEGGLAAEQGEQRDYVAVLTDAEETAADGDVDPVAVLDAYLDELRASSPRRI